MAHSIFSLNEHAVALFHMGDFMSAAELFRTGLGQLEKAYDSFEEDDDNDDENMECEDPNKNLSFSFASTQGPIHPNNDKDDHHQSSFRVYSNAMTLAFESNNKFDLSNLSEEQYNLLASVLLYNYGLCLHLCGIFTGSERHLQHAHSSYEVALGLLGLTDNMEVLQQSCTFLLELALLNNQGHINHCFFE